MEGSGGWKGLVDGRVWWVEGSGEMKGLVD